MCVHVLSLLIKLVRPTLSSLPCGFSLHLTPAVPGALSEQGEVTRRGVDACPGHLHCGFSNGEMWLPALSPSQSDALEA